MNRIFFLEALKDIRFVSKITQEEVVRYLGYENDETGILMLTQIQKTLTFILNTVKELEAKNQDLSDISINIIFPIIEGYTRQTIEEFDFYRIYAEKNF